MQELVCELSKLREELSKGITELKKRGKAKAETEKEYRIALAKEMLTQRDNNIPVTILSDLCRGKQEIALLKCFRDIAESDYECAMQFIYSVKLNLGIVENQINAERKGE
jgi:hypothetical protein